MRTRFEAERACRQFDVVEPENRLVARTLERAWETALARQHQAEADLVAQRARRPARLDDHEIAWLQHAGADLRRVFDSATTTIRDRKHLLRAIITEIVVTVRTSDRQANVRIIWEGGATNSFVLTMNKTGGHFRATDDNTNELVRRLAERYDDTTIATILGKQHRTTGTGLPFTRSRVCSLRNTHGIAVFHPDVTPSEDDAVVVTIYQAQKLLGVDKSTSIAGSAADSSPVHNSPLVAPSTCASPPSSATRSCPRSPTAGCRSIKQPSLGVARQTVLNKVQRGELAAVHVTHGKRNGLRIQVEPAAAGLFATIE